MTLVNPLRGKTVITSRRVFHCSSMPNLPGGWRIIIYLCFLFFFIIVHSDILVLIINVICGYKSRTRKRCIFGISYLPATERRRWYFVVVFFFESKKYCGLVVHVLSDRERLVHTQSAYDFVSHDR